MVESPDVTLELAAREDAPLLANLLELYAHDLSGTFGLDIGADGRFGYKTLPLYWSEPERKFPFFIRSATGVVGFALVTRGSPVTDDPDDFDVAEFFVLRRHRRSEVGRCAAELLWDRFAVRWIVRVSEGNRGGCEFWRRVIPAYSRGRYSHSTRPGATHPWRVFSFDSRNRGASA